MLFAEPIKLFNYFKAIIDHNDLEKYINRDKQKISRTSIPFRWWC